MVKVTDNFWREIPGGESSTELSLPEGESLMVSRSGSNTVITCGKEDEDERIYRFITAPEGCLSLKPALPDYPLVIKPSTSLAIMPGLNLNAYIEVPLLLNICFANGKNEQSLLELPLHTLSKSFFGSPESGEIAYFVESPLFDKVTNYERSHIAAYAPIRIVNRSTQILNFERMILRVPNLRLYSGGDFIYTSPVDINFKGLDQISQIRIRSTPPKGENMTLIAEPRRPVDKSIIRRSFYYMKNFYSG